MEKRYTYRAYGPSELYGQKGQIVYDYVASSSSVPLEQARERAARVTFTHGYRVGIYEETADGFRFVNPSYGPDEMWMNGAQIYSFIK